MWNHLVADVHCCRGSAVADGHYFRTVRHKEAFSMSAHTEITRAIAAHGMWKSRLNTAIQTGKSEYSVTTVEKDDQCDFGKWLKAAGPDLKNSPHFGKCCELHKQFHQKAGAVLSLALAGRKSEAEKAVDMNGEFSRLSSSLVTELMAWDKSAS
jgi:hypothetical protein